MILVLLIILLGRYNFVCIDAILSCSPDNTFNNKCYYFVATAKNWLSAEQYCISHGTNGHLAASVNGFVNLFLASW